MSTLLPQPFQTTSPTHLTRSNSPNLIKFLKIFFSTLQLLSHSKINLIQSSHFPSYVNIITHTSIFSVITNTFNLILLNILSLFFSQPLQTSHLMAVNFKSIPEIYSFPLKKYSYNISIPSKIITMISMNLFFFPQQLNHFLPKNLFSMLMT